LPQLAAARGGMRLKLTAVPLADGKYLVNRWRMMGASEHTEKIQDVWASQIGDNQSRIDQLADHLSKTPPQAFANRIFPGLHKAK
jgi:hypothetical protein